MRPQELENLRKLRKQNKRSLAFSSLAENFCILKFDKNNLWTFWKGADFDRKAERWELLNFVKTLNVPLL